MQNHLEIKSKSQFWTREVRNRTKTRHSLMSGPTVDSINQETHKGNIWNISGNIYGIYKGYPEISMI